MSEQPALVTAILVDGPMAGHLQTIPATCHTWAVRVPQPLRLGAGPASIAMDETVYYRIDRVTYNHGQYLAWIGWSAPVAQPYEAALYEHVPTGLAEQGILPWRDVPATTRDKTEPIQAEEVGDPLKPCDIKLPVPAYTWCTEIDAQCECGWSTERIALDRRAQLLRAAHRHVLGEALRRERYHLPVTVVDQGSGARPDCYGGIAVDDGVKRVHGRCRRCGWLTEPVEYYRTGPLRELCQAHTGPDGVRRVRDQLLAAFGLPAADEEER